MNSMNWSVILADVVGAICFAAFVFIGFMHYFRHLVDKRKIKWFQGMDSARVLVIGKGMINLWGAICITVGVLFVVSHLDSMKSIIDLNQSEFDLISKKSAAAIASDWQPVVSTPNRRWKPLLNKLSQRGVVLLVNKEDKSSVTQKYHRDWMSYLKANKVYGITCYWESISQCKFGSRIVMVGPGRWHKKSLDRLWSQGYSIWLNGYPNQLISKEISVWKWRGLHLSSLSDDESHKVEENSSKSVMLRSDQVLTLGLDTGNVLELQNPYPFVKAYSITAEAYRVDSENPLAKQFSTALYAHSSLNKNSGRIVWVDFPMASPAPKNKVLNGLKQNIISYLLAEPQVSLATWPEGRSFGGFLSQDTEDGYGNTKQVVDLVMKHNFSITWFILSDLAQKNRNLTRQMGLVGEMACHGDDHSSFAPLPLRTQSLRIARCQKVIMELTGQQAVSFRPPKEVYDNSLWKAFQVDGIKVGFVGFRKQKMLPQWYSNGNEQILVMPRFIKDDFNLFDEAKGAQEDIEPSLSALHEIDQIRKLGGLYSFSFHSQLMDNTKNLEVIRKIGQELQKQKAHFTTVKSIALWWRLKRQILAGVQIDAKKMAQFDPVIILRNRLGKIEKHKLSTENNPFIQSGAPSLSLARIGSEKIDLRRLKPRLEYNYLLDGQIEPQCCY